MTLQHLINQIHRADKAETQIDLEEEIPLHPQIQKFRNRWGEKPYKFAEDRPETVYDEVGK